MKNFLFLIFCFQLVFLHAQITTPAPSPFCKLEQKLGLGTVTVEYSRPSMKSRVVFGDLVPYDKMWRTGANASTKITFTEDVMVEGKTLAKGTYALYSIPGKETWDIIFYSDAIQSGLPKNYDITKEALKVRVSAEQTLSSVESFTIDINDIKADAATLNLIWENVLVSVKLKFDVESKVLKNIDKVLAGPSADDYYIAARYYFDNGKDNSSALMWIQKSNTADPQFWKLRLESLILAKAGRKQEAIEVATRSKTMAIAAGNDDYVKMNEDSIKEWSK
ncbi:MAG TPA: DUF2911 domain-containing protein [Saprospiraceae bacterium]|nr:DUF2911 domain-containing protein [Saprospiraceae bacterium]